MVKSDCQAFIDKGGATDAEHHGTLPARSHSATLFRLRSWSSRKEPVAACLEDYLMSSSDGQESLCPKRGLS